MYPFEPTHTLNKPILVWNTGTPVVAQVHGDCPDAVRCYTTKGGIFTTFRKNLTPIKKEEDMSHAEAMSRAGKMSGNRVHFTIPYSRLHKPTYAALIEETLGIPPGAYDKNTDLKVICRPSQFARFVILRSSKYGEQNQMSEMNAKLVTLAKPATSNLIDCSTRPNTVQGEAA